MAWYVNFVRSKDAQKQLARTSLIHTFRVLAHSDRDNFGGLLDILSKAWVTFLTPLETLGSL